MIINTKGRIDNYMIKRFSELNKLFKLIYNCSEKYQIPIKKIWIELKSKKTTLFQRNAFDKEIKNIKKEIKATKFNLQSEFRYFTYFVLEKIRMDLEKSADIILPNRLESSYFFGNIKDCITYLIGLYGLSYKTQSTNLKIIEVELKKITCLHKFDNNLLTQFNDDFQSKDFYSVLNSFLLGGKTKKPLYEYVFQGSYQIIRNDINI